MNKKIIISSLVAVGLVFGGVMYFTGGLKHSLSTGICLMTTNDKILVVVGDSPIEISNQSSDAGLFVGLETGDKVMMTHDGIDESYPAKTGVYKLVVSAKDCLDEVPQSTITELAELGWTIE